MTSVRDVAALAGVSVGTVSNVLNRPEVVSKRTILRVEKAIAQLGYVRNAAARQLRVGHGRSIGLIVLDADNPFFTAIARGAENRAAREGLTVLVGNSSEDEDRESAYLDFFEEQRVTGVLIAPVGDARARLNRLREHGIPAVLVDRQEGGAAFSSVAVDDVAGGRLAASHLIDAGRKRIAFIGGPLGLRQVDERLVGARQVADQGNTHLEIVETRALTVVQGQNAALQLLNRQASERPDAIFAANDLLAIGVLQALTNAGGIKVPDEIALIGYDDIPFASSSVVPLSSIRQPSELIGSTAVDLLLREVKDPANNERPQLLFHPELIARASTKSSM